MGYKYQFITLAGFHSINYSMFELASGYRDRGMAAYCELQNAEFDAEEQGYTATRHQREVGAGWFDAISVAVKGGQSATTTMDDSTKEAKFQGEEKPVAAEWETRVQFLFRSKGNAEGPGGQPALSLDGSREPEGVFAFPLPGFYGQFFYSDAIAIARSPRFVPVGGTFKSRL